MVFSNIEIKTSNTNSRGELTEDQGQEILDLLNAENFRTREELPTFYITPPTLEPSDHCHATARKYAEVNKNLTKVSGYLVLSTHRNANEVTLKAHSVVQDTNGQLFETMSAIYPLNKYDFIEHETGERGHDLEAWV